MMNSWKFGGSHSESERIVGELRRSIRVYELEKVYRGEEKTGRKYAEGVYLLQAMLTEEVFEILATFGPYEPENLLMNLEWMYLEGVKILEQEQSGIMERGSNQIKEEKSDSVREEVQTSAAGEEFKNENLGLGGSKQEKGGNCDKSRGEK